MRNETIGRYAKVLEHLSQRERGFRSVAKITAKFGVSQALSKILKKEGILSKVNGMWRYERPVGITTSDLAERILALVNADVTKKAVSLEYAKPLNIHANGGKEKGKSKGNGKDSFVVDILALRNERQRLMERVSKIDNLILIAESIREDLN